MGPQQAIYWPELSSLGAPVRVIAAAVFTTPLPEMPTKNDNHIFEGSDPVNALSRICGRMHGISSDEPREAHAVPEDGFGLTSDGAALGERVLAGPPGCASQTSLADIVPRLWRPMPHKADIREH